MAHELDRIDGYLELGMEREALETAKEVIAKDHVSAREFGSVLLAVLQTSRPRALRKQLARAHRRLVGRKKTAARRGVLRFKGDMEQVTHALRQTPNAGELADEDLAPTIHVYMGLGLREPAQKTAHLCLAAIHTSGEDSVKPVLVDALWAYFLWHHERK